MNAQQLLNQLNFLDENDRIEAKLASQIGRSIMETVCAFANEPGLEGGWLLLGVAQKDKDLHTGYKVQGISNPDKISSDLASQCSSIFNRPLRVEIKTESLEDKPVIKVYVPEAEPQDKPVYFKSTGLPKGAFRRIGSSDQRCTEDDLAVFYQSRQNTSFDRSLVQGAGIADLDGAAIDDYRKFRVEANPDAEELRWADNELLQALSAVSKEDAGKWTPTVAGMLLFGKSLALRRCFPMTRVDYIRVSGREWRPGNEHSIDTVEMRGPIISLLRRTLAAILDDIPRAFGFDEGSLQRSDKPIIPRRALREALVNALMHRCYRVNAPTQVIRYSNRIEIRNPGFSLKKPEQLGEPGSIARNPAIAAVLHETRFAETKGSGIRAIEEAMDAAGLAPPLFESDRGKNQFTAQFLFHHFLSEEDIEWLAGFQSLNLTNEEARALVAVRETGSIDNSTYRALNKVDALAASAALRRLRDAGLLRQEGRGSATWYRPDDKLVGAVTEKSPDSHLMGGEPDRLFSKSSHLSSKSSHLSSKSDPLSSKSGHLSSKPRSLSSEQEELFGKSELEDHDKLLNGLPDRLAEQVKTIGRRHPPDRIRDLIVELCKLRPWKVSEFVSLLQRNPETIRQSYLRPLLEQKRIALKYPESPNSPRQAYTSK